jgi:hypothetical protein
MGGFLVAIPNRLILYIFKISPTSLPLPASLKVIAKDFFVLFHISI